MHPLHLSFPLPMDKNKDKFGNERNKEYRKMIGTENRLPSYAA